MVTKASVGAGLGLTVFCKKRIPVSCEPVTFSVVSKEIYNGWE